MIKLEVTAHRFGGDPRFPRDFGPEIMNVIETGIDFRELSARLTASAVIRLTFSDWTRVDEEWRACRVRLEDINGSPLGLRPVMIFDQPYDIPTHTRFVPRHPEHGTFILGFRKI